MDKPYFHLQTRQMGCSAKCFLPDCVAVLCSQWRVGKLHAGMQSTSPPDTPAQEEKPPDEMPAQKKLLRSLSKSLAKIIFPRSSILCLFPNSCGRAEASAGRRCEGACAGGLTALPLGRCWVKHCQPAALLHIPSGSPPLCHQHSAALPVLKIFPREKTSTVFMVL